MRCTRRKQMTFVAHDQDQPPIRSNIAYLPTNQSGDIPPKVLCAYIFSPRTRQRCLKLAYMPKTSIKVFHSSPRTCQRCMELTYMPKTIVGVFHVSFGTCQRCMELTYMPKTIVGAFHVSFGTCQRFLELTYMSKITGAFHLEHIKND